MGSTSSRVDRSPFRRKDRDEVRDVGDLRGRSAQYQHVTVSQIRAGRPTSSSECLLLFPPPPFSGAVGRWIRACRVSSSDREKRLSHPG